MCELGEEEEVSPYVGECLECVCVTGNCALYA